LEDLQFNFLSAAPIIKARLPNLKNSATGASIVIFSTVAATTGMPPFMRPSPPPKVPLKA